MNKLKKLNYSLGILFIIFVIAIIIFTVNTEKASAKPYQNERLNIIYEQGALCIIQDNNTGVQYLLYTRWQHGAAITPLYNKQGYILKENNE